MASAVLAYLKGPLAWSNANVSPSRWPIQYSTGFTGASGATMNA